MMADTSSILDTHAREELGIDPEEVGAPAYEAAIQSLISSSSPWGAIFPIFLSFLDG
ncbi:MAG: hypothetical protein IPO22_02050 [Anaerolineales bacterium]|nr:hypothetical protein [Anaerolineales bacterium]